MRVLRLPIALSVALLRFSTTPFLCALPAEAIVGAVTYARLGPVDGWRFLSSATYRYDPGSVMPDRRLVAERPEITAVAAFGSGSFIPEHVEITLGVAYVCGSALAIRQHLRCRPPRVARRRHLRSDCHQHCAGHGRGVAAAAGVAPVGAGMVNGFRYVPTSISTWQVAGSISRVT